MTTLTVAKSVDYSTKSSILDLWKVLIAEKTLHKRLKRRMLNSKLFGKLVALRAKWQSPTFFFGYYRKISKKYLIHPLVVNAVGLYEQLF